MPEKRRKLLVAVAHFRKLLSEDRSEEEFEIGLEILLKSLEMELSQ